MKMLRSLAIFAVLVAAAPAQTPRPTPNPRSQTPQETPVLRIQLPGGTYTVAISALRAVSQHEYLVDGVARVTEVNIDTSGMLLPRFYYLEPAPPNTPSGLVNAGVEQTQRLLKEAAEKSGQDVWKKVIKSYPTTTHARTAEYRVESLEQLGKIFAAADQALRFQKDTRAEIGK